MSFYEDIRIAINKHSMDALSNTPDYVLANLVIEAIMNFNVATKGRDKFFNFKPEGENPNTAEPAKVATSAYITLDVDPRPAVFSDTYYPHITVGWINLKENEYDDGYLTRKLIEMCRYISEDYASFKPTVAGTGVLGEEKENVMFVEHEILQHIHEAVDNHISYQKEHPHFIPHVTYNSLGKGYVSLGKEYVPDTVEVTGVQAAIGYSDGTFKKIAEGKL